MAPQKVVVIGGGTGLAVLLRGLKTFDVEISAIVTVADDGGSSGRLRKELNVPPPGDVRNVLVALAEVEPLIEQLFQHRFKNGEGLSGHSLGNLLLAGMTSITGDFAQGITELSRVLNVRGKVLPASNDSLELSATLTDGTTIHGESNIPKANKPIANVWIEPKNPKALPETLKAIHEADKIVIGPGSLFTSVLPNLLVPEISEAIMQSSAKKMYICNVMTQFGETERYSASEHVMAIHQHVGTALFDYVIVNDAPIPNKVAMRYLDEHAEAVACDEEALLQLKLQVIRDDFILIDDGEHIRHHAKKISEVILSI
ncbi:YvcK family protein [Geomicrobium sp. JCM 19038]|uniref:gluconeogenesis factor YvcK family protein n=1 Tax=Geomicrobium sp. JCM 19038 TaxID=1460635 RepID=UPI0005A8819A|nr:YvcK family protein [Geomicrobium sp. JCM 19038]